MQDLIDSSPKKFKNTDKVATLAALDLFAKGNGALLEKDKREIFHSFVAKGIFFSPGRDRMGCRQSEYCQVE